MRLTPEELAEIEARINQIAIETVDRLRSEGNHILADMLYDPRKDEQHKPRFIVRYDGHNKYRRHGKWTGYNQTTGEQKPTP